MNRNVLSLRVLAGAAVAALALAGCGGNENGGTTEPGKTKLSGAVNADGSSTVGPLTKAAATLYGDEQPDVRVAVGISGTGGGFKKFCAGETDISDASRPIKDSEIEICNTNNVKYQQLVIANDALSVVVNKENTWAECLTVDQLKKIWEPTSKVKMWNELDPSFPAEEIKLFGPGTDSGTFDYFTAEVNGEEGASRADYTASEDDNVLVEGVAGSKGGLAYFGFTYYEENAGKLKLVKIDGGDGNCVEPSVEAAQKGTYKPLARPLFIYISDKGMQKAQVADFIDFYVKNIDQIVKEAQFIPLTAEQKTQLAADVAKLKG